MRKGSVDSKLVGIEDIYATLAEIVGVSVPSDEAPSSVSFANRLFSAGQGISTRETIVRPHSTAMSVQTETRKVTINFQEFGATNGGGIVLYDDLDNEVGSGVEISHDPQQCDLSEINFWAWSVRLSGSDEISKQNVDAFWQKIDSNNTKGMFCS